MSVFWVSVFHESSSLGLLGLLVNHDSRPFNLAVSGEEVLKLLLVNVRRHIADEDRGGEILGRFFSRWLFLLYLFRNFFSLNFSLFLSFLFHRIFLRFWLFLSNFSFFHLFSHKLLLGKREIQHNVSSFKFALIEFLDGLFTGSVIGELGKCKSFVEFFIVGILWNFNLSYFSKRF
jgi:hypothetical protein